MTGRLRESNSISSNLLEAQMKTQTTMQGQTAARHLCMHTWPSKTVTKFKWDDHNGRPRKKRRGVSRKWVQQAQFSQGKQRQLPAVVMMMAVMVLAWLAYSHCRARSMELESSVSVGASVWSSYGVGGKGSGEDAWWRSQSGRDSLAVTGIVQTAAGKLQTREHSNWLQQSGFVTFMPLLSHATAGRNDRFISHTQK